ncbi:MAG: permease-like cell division protein FtsX [Gammaproteobacteria bacterium]
MKRHIRRRDRDSVALSGLLDQHRRSALRSIHDLLRYPVATLMTLLVIGITLALPASLLALLQVSNSVAGSQPHVPSLSMFLKPGILDEKALTLAATLEQEPGIERVELLTSADAMEEFRAYSGFGSALDALEENPLPHVLLVQLSDGIDKVAMDDLVAKLRTLPATDMVDYDQGWIERLQAIAEALRRAIQAIGLGLALAVMLIIGNTIRLEILNRKEEIEVTRLVGGSNAFIRRPFLYKGLAYGLLGALLAWLFVALLLLIVSGPLGRLADLYDAQISIGLFGARALVLLVPVGVILGLTGAWLAVSRHLAAIRPE